MMATLKQSKKIFFMALGFGILVGMAINWSTDTLSRYAQIIDKIGYKTDAQQPVVKAFKIDSYFRTNNELLIRLGMIKIRECGAPVNVVFTFIKDGEDDTKILHYRMVTPEGQAKGSFTKAPVDPEKWQLSSWFIIKDIGQGKLFITTTHACEIKFIDDKREIMENSAPAIDVVTKTYGPFQIGNSTEIRNQDLTSNKTEYIMQNYGFTNRR